MGLGEVARGMNAYVHAIFRCFCYNGVFGGLGRLVVTPLRVVGLGMLGQYSVLKPVPLSRGGQGPQILV